MNVDGLIGLGRPIRVSTLLQPRLRNISRALSEIGDIPDRIVKVPRRNSLLYRRDVA